MITLVQYFGNKPKPIEHEANANMLLADVNVLLHKADIDGVYGYWIDPDTNSQISGSKGGSGDGGYRLPDSKTGVKGSKHKTANAVDVYDPDRKLAQWLVLNKDHIFNAGLFCEDFRWTPTWCHFQNVAPSSRKVIFIPYADWKKHPPCSALECQPPLPYQVK